MVGGAPVTQEFADEMGADAYGANAVDCVQKAKDIVLLINNEFKKSLDKDKAIKSLDKLFDIFKEISFNADEILKVGALTKMQNLDVQQNLNVKSAPYKEIWRVSMHWIRFTGL